MGVFLKFLLCESLRKLSRPQDEISGAEMCESGFGFKSGFRLFKLDSDSYSDLKNIRIRIQGRRGGFGFEVPGFAHH